MKAPLRYILPAVMGLISAALMAWDIHNQHVIMSMGMAWDTGAPLWPYQTPDTLLVALNVPAYLIAAPFTRLLHLLVPRHYFALYPSILLWWWLAGHYLEQRSKRVSTRNAPIAAIMLCLLSLGLIIFGAQESRWAFRWWWTYSRTLLSVSDLILLRLLAPCVWCVTLGLVALLAAWRRRPLGTPASA
jgi:hypothetical protein